MLEQFLESLRDEARQAVSIENPLEFGEASELGEAGSLGFTWMGQRV